MTPARMSSRLLISIHALLAESDLLAVLYRILRMLFLSTLSLRRATHPDQNIRGALPISIHALLAESDGLYDTYAKVLRVFLSTLSLRRATPMQKGQVYYIRFLSTLSLRRATRTPTTVDTLICISIHALLAESDYIPVNTFFAIFEFLSTLSLRRATISIALLILLTRFLSTLSLRRATRNNRKIKQGNKISIHALLAESDLLMLSMGAILISFLSTLSLRRATH